MNLISPKSCLSVILLFFFISFGSVSAQTIRCATMEMDSILRANDPSIETHQQFEDWMQSEIMAQQSMFQINGVYTIPVVFHVIHNGEAVGTGTNVSQAAIQSQLDVLNEDFRRIFGTNGYNTNPVGADTEIEFCMAQRRPDGSTFTEPGINRINRNTAGFTAPPYTTAYIDGTIKPWTYNGGVPTAQRGWDPGKYMNIWICNISGGILGYAQFPQSPLGGMSCGAPSLATDGVVFLYSSIGKSSVTGFPPPYNEGRTATHEVGHWLGLRHIWGDNPDCIVDDYCNDTPLHANANFGCPTGTNSCAGGGNDQIENYMDYTDDLCMNMFSQDQKMRMRAVLTGTPLRLSLITSDACIPPSTNDASIVGILNPVGDNCAGAITPQVTLRNRGSANLTSATISYTIDGGTPTNFAFSGSVAPGASVNVTLPAFNTTLGTHMFTAYSTLPNGVADPNPAYDTTAIQFAVSNGYMGPYTQDFEAGSFPPDVKWNVVNASSDCTTWMGESAISSSGATINNAGMVRYFNVTTANTEDYIYTPIFILPCNATVANFSFDVAYRQRNASSNDRLRVEISTNCGSTWVVAPVYDQQGTVLATVTPSSNTSFTPTAAGNWQNEVVNLMPFVTGTSQSIKLRFRATNTGGGNSNNIWVDNFAYNTTTPGEVNVTQGVTTILDDGAYSFGTTPVGTPVNITFTVQNTGTTNLILTPPINITGTAFTVSTSFGTTTVAPGGSTTFTITFNPGVSGFFNETLSFGTNDCDEGTYNFQLTGTGTGGGPVAAFTGTPTTVCIGQNVTFTDMSTGATSWSWNFGAGATPATASTQGPHVVTYSTAGSKTVALTINGTTTNTQPNYITVNAPPTTANAGVDQTVCAATATMAGNVPATGTGTWTFISGPATPTITTPGSATSGITGMTATGTYTFQWTISNNPCTPSSDQMTITRNAPPTAANAGVDQTICITPGTATMAGNTPLTGTGTWTQISGPVTGTITTPSSPTTTITGLTTAGNYIFQWNISNAPCVASTDQIQVTVNPSPTVANAGIDQTVCAATATMAANVPATGTGTWTFISGPVTPTITTPGSATSGITGMTGTGTYTFQWTITNAPCPASSDQMTITRNAPPTTSNAGVDQIICVSGGTVTMAANTPAIGTGTWTQISGPVTGTITTPNSPTTTITGLTTAGTYVFQWSITNAPCVASNDQMQVTVNPVPTTANAGVDQTICAATATMAANVPTVGTGTWTFVSGPVTPTITTPGSATSGITGMSSVGAYTFQWTITNAPCTPSSDQMTIIRNAPPTVSNAGVDQTICVTSGVATMAGNTPAIGTGTWTQISGPVTGTITTPNSPTTTITGLTTTGNYVFQWTIANAPCVASTDQMQVTVNPAPTTANAGIDQTICVVSGSATMAGNSAAVGTGTWTQISGPVTGTITTPSSPTTTITGLTTAGIYVFQWSITNAPCTASTDQVQVTVNAQPTAANAGVDQTICSSTGTMAANTPSVGTGTWTFISGPVTPTITTPGSPNSGITGMTNNGVYTFQWTIANAPCTSSSDQMTITRNTAPTTANAGVDQTICSISGSATMAGNTPVVGTGSWTQVSGPVSASITTPSSPTTTITGMSTAGTYIFQWSITNAPCVASTDQMQVVVNDPPTAANAGVDQNICSNSTSMTGNTAVVGTGTWSQISGPVVGTITTPGSPATTITGLNAAGTYVFQWTITNAPCTASSDQMQITVTSPPTTANAGIDQTICSTGGSATMTGNTPGIGTGTWTQISGPVSGTITTPSSPTTTITGLTTAGVYVFQWSIANAPCTTSNDQMQVTVNDPPTTANAGVDQALCSSTAVMAGNNPTVGSGIWTQISGPVSGTITTPSSATTTISGLTTAGVYVFQWTITNAPCTASSDQMQVTITNPPTTANAGIDQTICSTGGSATMAGNTPAIGTGTWTQISGPVSGTITTPSSPTTTITGLTTAGVYIFQWSIANAPCTASNDQMQVTVNDPPTAANAGTDQTLCSSTATMAGNTPSVGSGTWTFISGPATPTITSPNLATSGITGLNTAGTYTFQWTITNAPCLASSDQMTITINANPTVANAGPDQNMCSGLGSVTMAGNAPTVGTGTWTQISGPVAATITTPSSPTTSVTGMTVVGTYVFEWSIANNPCVASTDQMQVVIGAGPTVSISGTTTICEGNSTTLTASGATSYEWSEGQLTPAIVVGPTANYNYFVVGTDPTGCSDTAFVTVIVNPLPPVGINGIPSVCLGSSTTLTGVGANSYVWDFGPTTASIMVAPTTSTSYTVTGTDLNNCSNTASVTVAVNPIPTINAGSDVLICPGITTTLTATGGLSYVWDNGIGAGNPVNVAPTSTTTYIVQGSDLNGCSNFDTVTVNVSVLPTVVFNSLPDTICLASGSLTLSGTPSGGTFAGTGISGNIFNPTSSGTGMFSLGYTVMNADNCPATDNEVITVIGCQGIEDNEGVFVEIYPNPSDAFVNISSSEIIELIEIYDMLGKVIVVNGNDNQTMMVSLQEFTNGVYNFRIYTDKGIVVKRVVRK